MTEKEISSPPPPSLVTAIASGTLLTPLNSSMIAVALVSLQLQFRVSTATVTWLISAFYLTAAVGMPIMGRIADQFGARRVFSLGVLLVGIGGVAAPFVPSFGWLVGIRAVQALGASSPFPAGMSILRSRDPRGRTPAQALGALSMSSSVSAAIGPVIAGFLVVAAGWPSIFWINVPLVLLSLFLAVRWLPGDQPSTRPASLSSFLQRLDLPGVGLFGGTLVCLLGFFLSLASGAIWPLLPASLIAGTWLFHRERSVELPFFDVRLLVSDLKLSSIYLQFAAVNVAFYSVFFGLPIWVEQSRHLGPGFAGLMLLPLSAVAVSVTPLCAWLIGRSGPRPSLILGAFGLIVSFVLLLLFDSTTPLAILLVVSAVLGIPGGFNNLGLQAALYQQAPPSQMGAAGGQFQTSRYIGSILSTALLAIVFGSTVTTQGLHGIALAMLGLSAALLIAAWKL
ncbi:MAG: MFS transporter [Chloroflexota bacterium]|nr:MFS transporter [Chloroflexota bacterium]